MEQTLPARCRTEGPPRRPRAGSIATVLKRAKRAIARAVGLENVIRTMQMRLDVLERNARNHEAISLVVPATMLMEQAIVHSDLTVSIVMATRNRREMLERAVRSVFAGQYHRWQLVVVDDGSTDGTAEYLDSLDDPRVVVVHTQHAGSAAARNLGLDHATGEWVTFLDDDNVMGSVWPKAIVEFAGRNPDARAIYGGQVRQRDPGIGPPEHGWTLYVDPFASADLPFGNFVDLGALAVRRDVDQLWFDPELKRMIDWELVVRLAATCELHPVPVLAGLYYARHDGRITDTRRDDAVEGFSARLADPADPLGTPRQRPAGR